MLRSLVAPAATRRLAPALLALLLVQPLQGQSAPPSPEDVLGYPMGAHFTDYDGVRRYSRALADASPLVEYQPYGVTPEGRELFQLVIAAPEHRARLDDILAADAELFEPDTPEARAREIAASNPAVVYFSYGVHGNESSSSEAGMWTAWDLARGAPEVAGVLDSLVVVIDPVTNPDGRDRYVQWFKTAVGETPNPDPRAREHSEPWPGGRYNHYLFDLNRDWAWMSQPETRARLETWTRWNPVVHVDFHEMGYNSSYFFFPAADPINPIYPEYVLDWARRIGEGNARTFDAAGWAYFTGDNYDFFYPGYGDTWPSLLGGIGMTYEQGGGGSAGLAVERSDGDTLTLADRAAHHRASGQATLRTAANGKTRLLLDVAAAQRSVGTDAPDVLLVPGDDPARVEMLVAHLRRQGIEVQRAGEAFRARAEAYPGYEPRGQFPAGTYRVPARQARGRLATTLLQPHTELDAEFSYDISAWSLPYAYGVEAHSVRGSAGVGWAPVPAVTGELESSAPEPGYGYLVAPGAAASYGIASYLREGGRVRVLSRESTIGGRAWPVGSWFLPAAGDPDVAARATSAGLGDLVTAVASGFADAGADLGSASVRTVQLPHVAVLTGEGVTPTSYGAHWYFLEQMLRMPFDALPLGSVARTDLADYDVIVVPESRGMDEGTRNALKAWIERGGRLVAVGSGARAAAQIAEVELHDGEAEDSASTEELLLGRRERERRSWLEQVPGAILETRVDPAHPLAWGSGDGTDGDRLFVLYSGGPTFAPAERVEAVAYFPEDLDATSGVISDPNLEGLEQSIWLATKRLGSGSVVLFADDPLFRLFWRGAHPAYVNALLIGP